MGGQATDPPHVPTPDLESLALLASEDGGLAFLEALEKLHALEDELTSDTKQGPAEGGMGDAVAPYPEQPKTTANRGRKRTTEDQDLARAWGRPTWRQVLLSPVERLVRARPYEDERPYCTRTGREGLWHCEKHGWMRGYQPCDKLDCETCYPRVKARRGMALFERFGGVPVAGWVFTFGPELRAHLGVTQLPLVRRRIVSMLEAFYGAHFGLVGIIVNFHPCGEGPKSNVPGERTPDGWNFLPHFHVLIPLVAYEPKIEPGHLHPAGKEAEFKYLEGHLTRKQLSDARAAWTQVLFELADVFNVDRDSVGINLNYGYRKEADKIHNRYAYDARPFPAWRAGGMPDTLARTHVYGLAAPKQGAELVDVAGVWRAIVRGTTPEPGRRCPHNGCEHKLTQALDVLGRPLLLRVGGAAYERAGWHWYDSADELRTTGPPP